MTLVDADRKSSADATISIIPRIHEVAILIRGNFVFKSSKPIHKRADSCRSPDAKFV